MSIKLVKLLALAASVVNVAATPTPPLAARDDADAQLKSLAQQAHDQATEALGSLQERGESQGSCSLSNLKVRREWNTLSKQERKSYISAVQCITSKPSKTPSDLAPGAKTRFDDFVATHINQTLAIHYTGNFLSWHRYYTWLYEEALREECGYTGTQPYWDWGLTAAVGMTNTGMLDGSPTSMSGNGAKIEQADTFQLTFGDLPPLVLPTGNGGGCIEKGPFKGMQVHMGPASLAIPGAGGVPEVAANPLAYNPRCLKRDLTDPINQDFANWTATLDLILNTDNVADFQLQMQGAPGSGNIGVHGGGHYAMGGDPGRDVFVSPGDPLFYLHHSQIDRVWWIWQALDLKTRAQGETAVAGTNTFANQPPSANTTTEDFVNYGFAAGPPRPIKDLLSTTAGPFCYVYL